MRSESGSTRRAQAPSTFSSRAILTTAVQFAHVVVGAGAGSTSLHLKSRTQDGLYMSWPNMLPQGGSEVLLFYVDD
jgi:hypothetical protein